MASPKTTALVNKIKGVKRAVIDKTSDVLSAPKRAYYGLKSAKSNRNANILRQARMYDNAPDFDDKGNVTDAFKMRSMAQSIRDQYSKK